MKKPVEVMFSCFVISLFAVMTCLSCVPKLTMPGIKPAKPYWEGIRDVALLKFDGPYGEMVRHHIHNRLTEVRHFNPLDMAQHPALDEISYDMLAGAELLHIAEELQADLVIAGRVAGAVNDTHGSDQVQLKEGTGYYKKEKNIDGQWVDVEIKRTVIRSVPYVIRQASVAIEYRVFEMSTGGIIATGTLAEDYNDKIGGDKWHMSANHSMGEIPSPSATMDELSARIAAELVAKLSSMKTLAIVEFDSSGNSIVRRGVALARDGAWKDAIQLWQEVIKNEPASAAALYNLGVAHEVVGDIENLRAALDLYERAAIYGDKNLYADGIARVKRFIKEQDNN